MKVRSVGLVAVGLLCVATACGSKKKDGSGGGDSAEQAAGPAYHSRDVSALATPDMFALIPADSPLVMAGYEPVPREMIEKFAGAFAPMGDVIEQGLREGMADAGHPVLRALAAELDGKISIAGLESLGFKLNPRFAAYMIGTSFAMRFELSDGSKLSGLLARLEQAGDLGARKATLQGVDYRAWREEGALIAVAVIGDQLVFGVMHENAADAVLPVLLGVQKPERSLADSDSLKAIVGKYGFLGVGTGYFDTRALAKMFTGEASALSTKVVQATGLGGPGMSDACKRELSELSEIAPRMVFGYTALDAKRAESLAVVELRKDIAADIAKLQAPVPGLANITDSSPLFAMGMGLDLGKTLEWTRGKASAVAASPYQCEWLSWLNDGAEGIAEGLSSPLPPLVGDFEGFVMVVQSVKLGGMMPSGSGFALVGMESPMKAIDMAKGAVPQLAGVKVTTDGKPVPIDLGMPALGDAHIAVKGHWLGASLGPGMVDRMTKLVSTTPAKGGPFAVIAYDYGQYMKLLGDVMTMGGTADMAGMMQGLIDLFGLMRSDLYLTDEGVVMKYSMQFR